MDCRLLLVQWFGSVSATDSRNINQIRFERNQEMGNKTADLRFLRFGFPFAFCLFVLFGEKSGVFVRSGPCEPAGRSVHQRAPPAEPHSTQDRRAGGTRSASVCYQSHVARVSRLRQ